MKLNDLMPNEGARKERKRKGQGISAGQGKTAGRGTKGQASRTGEGGHLYRQGGNLPFYRRLPFMRGEGFTPPNRVEYNEVNLEMLERLDDSQEITPEVLAEANLLSKKNNPIVILGRGEVEKAYKLKVHRITKGAREKIEAAGGSIELIG